MTLTAVWDAREASWQYRPEKAQWLRDRGLPADDIYRAEFYLAAEPFARIFCYSRDADGHKHWNASHDAWREHDHSLCDVAREPPRDVPLRELPPW
jgi:hypothetical protein